MKITQLIILIAVLSIVLISCTGITGNAARPPPPAPSGGGCGVAAPVSEATAPATVPLNTESLHL